MNTIFLDASVLVRVSKDSSLTNILINYVNKHGYTILIGTMTLVELYRRPGQQWGDIAEFLSSVPFCIATNSDRILDAEVSSYPNDIKLPLNFCSSDYGFSKSEIKNAIEINMKGKIAQFDTGYRAMQTS